MMARSHIIAGAASWVAYSTLSGMALNPLLVVVAAGASLLPDIDHPGSTFGRMIKPVSYLISKIFGHRGITHSLFAVFALMWALMHYGNMGNHLVAAIVVGYLSHLLADFMSASGVPLFYPLKQKFCFPFPVTTGGIGEYVIVAAVIVATLMHIVSPDTQYSNVFAMLKLTVNLIT